MTLNLLREQGPASRRAMGSDDCHRCERPVLKNGRVGASYNIGNREESRVKYAFFLSPAEAVFLEFINVQY